MFENLTGFVQLDLLVISFAEIILNRSRSCVLPYMDSIRVSPAEPQSVLANTDSGHCFFLVHMEMTISRLYPSLTFLEVGFMIRSS